jgi:hypothetical protein
MCLANSRPKTGEEECTRTLDRSKLLPDTMQWRTVQGFLAFLEQTLCELLRRRKLSRPLLTIGGSSFALSLSLCPRSLFHTDDTVPPATCYASVSEKSSSDQIKTESDSGESHGATPAHVCADDEIGEDHDAQQQPEVS